MVDRATRRQFIGTLTAGGASVLLSARPRWAEASIGQARDAQPAARRIDIHQHFVSPSFLAFLGMKNAVSPVPGFAAWKDYSPARAVETLDRVGTQTAMLSITAPGVWFGDAHVLWRDFEGLGRTFGTEAKGVQVARLQRLLTRAGLYKGAATGTFDAATEADASVQK